MHSISRSRFSPRALRVAESLADCRRPSVRRFAGRPAVRPADCVIKLATQCLINGSDEWHASDDDDDDDPTLEIEVSCEKSESYDLDV